MGSFLHRHRGFTPYLLLAPGVLWLAIFFLIPLAFLGYESLQSGLFPDFKFTWEFSNFSNGIRDRPCAMSSASATRRIPASRDSGSPSARWLVIAWRTSETTTVRSGSS